MKAHFLAVFLLAILMANQVLADQTAIKQQSQGEVSFISGGVGEEERNAMQALRSDYNLNMQFSVKDTGEYLSDVKVRIQDASGAVCLETVSDGPRLFAKLKSGLYTVSAEQNGYEIGKKVKVASQKTSSLIFIWPKE